MRGLLLVARYEYLRFVRRRAFLLGVFGLPLFLVLLMGLGALSAVGGEEVDVGYVDGAGVLDPRVLETSDDEDIREARFHAYASEVEGRAALEAGRVQSLFVIPADYLEMRALTALTADEEIDDAARVALADFLEESLARRQAPAVAERLLEGPEVTIRAADGSREVAASEAFFSFIIPFGAGFLFIFAAVSSAGYLLQAVTDEKENRTVEILTTSVSPTQLIVGKATGLIGVAGTQLGVWSLGVATAAVVGAQFIEPLAQLAIPWSFLAVVVAFFVPAYLLLAAIMVSIGSAFPEYRQSQQVVGVVNILFFAPFFFTTLVFANPNGGLALFLTLFPTTSFLTVTMRWAATSIPAWELLLSWGLLVLASAALLWIAPRIFRAGMLRYGQRLSLSSSWRALRSGGR